MAAAMVVSRKWIRYGGLLALIAGTFLVGSGVLEATGRLDGYGNLVRLAYGVPSALLIAGLAAWESGPRRVPKLLVALGEASYSLYLFHLLGIGVLWQIWLRSGIETATRVVFCYAFLLGGAIGCGLAVHHLIEAPLLRYLRRPSRRGENSRSAPPASGAV